MISVPNADNIVRLTMFVGVMVTPKKMNACRSGIAMDAVGRCEVIVLAVIMIQKEDW